MGYNCVMNYLCKRNATIIIAIILTVVLALLLVANVFTLAMPTSANALEVDAAQTAEALNLVEHSARSDANTQGDGALTGDAFANDMQTNNALSSITLSNDVLLDNTITNSLQTSDIQTQVVIISIPGLRWSHISNQYTPTIYTMAKDGAIANLVTNNAWLYLSEGRHPSISLHHCTVIEGMSELDAAVRKIVASYPSGTCFVIVGSDAFEYESWQRSLTPVILSYTDKFSGYLNSPTTRRTGLIAGTDIEDYAVWLNNTSTNNSEDSKLTGVDSDNDSGGSGGNGGGSSGGNGGGGYDSGNDSGSGNNENAAAETNENENATQSDTGSILTTTHPQGNKGVALSCQPEPDLQKRIEFLQHNANICEIVDDTKEAMDLVFLALFLTAAAASLVLLFLEVNIGNRALRWLVPLTRGLLLVVLAYPVSTFLMFLIPPELYTILDTHTMLIAYCVFWSLLLVLIALVIGQRSRWIYALFFLFILTFVVILVDQLLNGPLTLTGFLNYEANFGVRYYGLGNEGAALLFGSWFTFSGLVVNRFAHAKLTPLFKRWGFALISTLLIVISTLPQFGASFGVLIWATMGTTVAWWLFAGRPIRVRFLLISLALAAILAIGIMMADLAFNPYPHLENMAAYLGGNPLELLLGVFNEISAYSLATVVYSPILSIIFVLVFLSLFLLAAV
ncbi:MAG: hypothetical protein LBG97_06810, partial [Coriobacteriales bacterium]|nr:hypothetical protein [Coriobacteriales bacterium]